MSDKQNFEEERNKNRVYSSAINKCKNPIWKQIETNVYHSPDAWLLYYYTTIDFLSQFIYNTHTLPVEKTTKATYYFISVQITLLPKTIFYKTIITLLYSQYNLIHKICN